MNAPCQRPRTLEGRPPARLEESWRSPASLRLQEAEGVFRDLASQMRAIAQNEILAVWIVKLLRYDPVMASAGLIGMADVVASIVVGAPAAVLASEKTLNCSRAVVEWQFKLNKQEDRHVEGSKRK